jgi:hypothetical protein
MMIHGFRLRAAPWNAAATITAEFASTSDRPHIANSDQVHGKAAASRPHSKVGFAGIRGTRYFALRNLSAP